MQCLGANCIGAKISVISTDNSADDDATTWFTAKESHVEPDSTFEGVSTQNRIITAMVARHTGDFLFCAREDGSVFVSNARTGDESQILFTHEEEIAVSSLAWNARESLLAATDLSGRVTVRSIDIRRSKDWAVAQPIINRRSEHAIHKIVIQPSGEHILDSTSTDDYLWDATGHRVAVRHPLDHSVRHWQSHPQNPNWLLLLGSGNVEILRWDSLEKLTSFPCTLPATESMNEFGLSGVEVINGNKFLALEHLSSNRSPISRHITVWSTDGLKPGTKELQRLATYSRVPCEMLFVIGIYGSLLVFLNHHYWVCSLDLELTEDNSYARHFLIPPDWLNAGHHIQCCITIRGDLAIVRGQDIVVVRHGLTVQDRVFLEEKLPL